MHGHPPLRTWFFHCSQQLNRFFSYRGMLQFKAKYATSWEPRYIIYRNVLHLPGVALALRRVSEIKG